MKSEFLKYSGISLIMGSVLMIVTMVLHPVGGNFENLLKIVRIGMISHSIGILSVPFVAYGFWGLTKYYDEEHFFSKVAFSTMFFGLVAVMIAAAINGLILMNFAQQYEGATDDTIKSLKPIFVLISSFNHAFDFIYIGAVCISTLFWSIGILKNKLLPKWIGYYGILLVAFVLVMTLVGFAFVSLHGFRIFVFGYMAWTIGIGYLLTKAE